MIPYSVTVNNCTLAADLVALVAALEPSDLPKLEKAYLHLSGLHAVFTQLLAPAEPADADLRAELEHQKQLNAALCDRVHAQAEMLARRAEAAASQVCGSCPAFLSDAESIAAGRCFGCRSPGPARRVDEPPVEVPVATAEPAPAPAAPVVAAIRAEPSANGNQPRHPARELGARNRLAIARALANGPLSLKEVAAATGIVYGTVASIFASYNTTPAWFVKDDRRGAPYQLTDAGRKALAEDGYVLVPGAESSPPEPATTAAVSATTGTVSETVAESGPPDDDSPITVQELSRRQALAIAKAIYEAETPELSRAEIEAATGLSETVVKQRLMANSSAHGLPATRYFAKRDGAWGLTHVGVALVKERA